MLSLISCDMKKILILTALLFSIHCHEETEKKNQLALLAVGIGQSSTVPSLGSTCTSNSQCSENIKCINGTCGGKFSTTGSSALGATCIYDSSFKSNTCLNSTCGTTNLCGGKGAACTANSECGTSGNNPGCGTLTCSSTSCTQLCGGTGSACTANNQCINNTCSGGFCN
ncbi:hypothetical protein [Leptospira limi]|uniref:Lipoprotein n=1 Tax=Leptospira limi TaxID=2950023 RepID=A0ABT3LXC3_9LEPT|nr:hypothetical protein [Leptospira limi]MCW7462017.1 hypothetical protein [Leptospira limi]